VRIWLLSVLVVLIGCGGGGGSNSTTNTQPTPTLNSITVTPASPSVTVGQTQQFKATGTYSDNSTKDVTGLATWNSSDTTIATIASSGLATSLKAGSVTITGTLQTVNGSTSLGVSAPPPPQVSVSILPISVNVAAGGSQQFSASVTGSTNTAVAWEVSGIAGGNASVGTISATGLYTAPMSAGTIIVSAVAQANQSDSGMANVSILAPHSLGVRASGSGIAEFFNRGDGTEFTPRGNNYIRLAWQTAPWGQDYYHSTFNVGVYDSALTENALTGMQNAGYNVVRVFLNGCCLNSIGNPVGGLSSDYIANVTDFLGRAAKHNIYVILTWEWLPNSGGYDTGSCDQFGDVNVINLCPGGVSASVHFFHDLIQALISQGADLEAIFAYEIRNEYYYESDAAPLSWTSGMVSAADEQTYDMSSALSRQQMMDNGLTYFSDRVQAAIVALDPTALVTVGFFQPQAPNPTRIGDPRVIEVYPAISNSTVDFVDLHAYPIPADLTLAQLVQNYGFIGYQQQKPVLMGEFGAFKNSYSLITDAAAALQGWQTQSCAYNFKGWALWTWDTDEQPELWNALSEGEVINQTLSPMSRPNPCVGP
jgi:hypothetical protein